MSSSRLSLRGTDWKKLLDIVAAVAMIAVAIGFFVQWMQRPAGPVRTEVALPTKPVLVDPSTTVGNVGAGIVMIEYSDFQCPFCRRFAADTLPLIKRDYVAVGSVLLAFQNLPLTAIHPQAQRAGEAAECAKRQGRLWPMHDRLFEEPELLDDRSLASHAKSVGVDVGSFDACMSGLVTQAVEDSVRTAKGLGIVSTPAFLIGRLDKNGSATITHRVSGARPYEDFRKALDEALATQKD